MWTNALTVTLALFLVLGGIGVTVSMFFDRESFLQRVWKRHYNPWSWYARFLFSFVLYVGVWVRSWPVVLLSIACLATCSFWFPIPARRDTFVAHAVNGEVLWKKQPWTVEKAIPPTIIGVLCFIGFYALWERHLVTAVVSLGAMTFYKLWWLRGLARISRAQGQPL